MDGNRKRGMNVSVTSLSKLISTRKEELARLLEWRGTNFPVVERQNDLRISFIELELEDLEELNNQPQLNENQQIVLEWWIKKLNEEGKDADPLGVICAMQSYGLRDETIYDAAVNLTPVQQFQVLAAFAELGMEQEEE